MVRVAMMPGIAQAKLDSSGMKARPDSPTLPISRSSKKRGARQVPGVFEQQDEKEQDDDLRQEHQHAADAGQHAVDQQIPQQARRQRMTQPSAECADAVS